MERNMDGWFGGWVAGKGGNETDGGHQHQGREGETGRETLKHTESALCAEKRGKKGGKDGRE